MGNWTTAQYIVFSAPFALVLIGLLLWIFVRKSVRTRSMMNTQLKKDPDISEWLVVFDWTRKILYMPIILVSIAFFIVSLITKEYSGTMGAVWLGLFLVNFMIEEYAVGIKELLLILSGMGGLVLWLGYLDWLDDIWHFLGTISADMNGLAYLIFALIFLVGIAVSWIRGLFHYVAFTPNYINVQKGATESGEQIGREDISTVVDTEDLLARILGFGQIVVTFREPRKKDIRLLVWGIGKKSRILESIRGAIVVERNATEPL